MQLLKTKILGLSFFITGIALGQTGPAGVGMNDGTSALKLWLDANTETYNDTIPAIKAYNGTKVKFWKDLSGSNNDVRAFADSNSPTLIEASPYLNSQNAIRFFRDNDPTNRRNYLKSKSFSPSNDITIYCVFHALSKAGGNNVTPYKANNYDPNMWYSGAGLVDAGAQGFTNDVSLAFCDTSLAAGAGDSTTLTDYCVKTPASIHKTYFACLQKEAWTGNLSIQHNTNWATVYKGGTQPINDAPQYFVGSTSDILSGRTSPFFDGFISNVLIYNRLLNAAEKIILENYLSAKYDLPLMYNDLYKFDEPISGNYDHELIGIGKAVDGSFQLSAKGEGIIELNNAQELDKGEFIFIAHNGKLLSPSTEDLPEGIQFRLDRKWIYSKNGNTQNVDLIVDSKELSVIDRQNIVLLIDTDNDGSFADEKVGEGMIFPSEITTHNRFVFRGTVLKSANCFTFAQIKPICKADCDAYFSPDGDGVSDVYYLEDSGKTTIYDRAGKMIKSMPTPAYWDGTNEKGEPSAPGLYFIVANNDTQKTVTLIK